MPDLRITQLPEETTAANDEPLAIVGDPAGSPETRKIQKSNLLIKTATLVVAPEGNGGADYYTDGTDDDVQINQAIYDLLNWAGTNGSGRVIVREGVYNIGSTIHIPRSGIIVEGQGDATQILLQDSSDVDCIRLGHGSIVTRSDISFANVNPDTIITVAGDFVAAGYVVGGRITISGSTSNNGTYTIASVSTLVITLIATDALTTELAGASVTITPTTTVKSELCHVKVDGNMNNQTTGHGVNILEFCSEAKVLDCTVQNTVKANIYDDGAVYTEIKDNYLDTTLVDEGWSNVEGVGNYGVVEGNVCLVGDYANIAVYNGTVGVSVRGNYVFNSRAKGISNEGIPNSIIQGNYIENPTSYGIYFNEALLTITDNTVYITNNPTAAIKSTSPRGTVISDNRVYVDTGNTEAVTGIDVVGSDYIISNNNVYFKTYTEAHIGINLTGTEMVVDGNFIIKDDQGNNGTGIICGSTDFTFSNNVVKFFNLTLDINGASLDATINGNVFLFNNAGIDISSAQNISITGNTFEGATSNFIFSSTNSFSNNVLISGNVFYDCDQEAIYLRSVHNSTITANTFKDCANGASDTYAIILFITASGTNYSGHNIVNGNVFETLAGNAPKYCIRENSSNDGPNIVTSNVALNAVTAQISLQHGSSINNNNITS